MKPAIIKISIGLVIVGVLVGLFVEAVTKVRQAARGTTCINNLMQLGLAIHSYHDVYKRFPPGSVGTPDVPPDKRLSWITAVRPYIESSPDQPMLDSARAWDSPENCPPLWRLGHGVMGIVVLEEVRRDQRVACLLCPIRENIETAWGIYPTSYLAIAGLGENAADLSQKDPRAGVFGHDRKVTLADLKHPESTALLIESLDGGPWTAGGRHTMRRLISNQLPYIGEDGQFSSKHPGGSNFLFADGTVRFIGSDVSSQTIEAMMTIARVE